MLASSYLCPKINRLNRNKNLIKNQIEDSLNLFNVLKDGDDLNSIGIIAKTIGYLYYYIFDDVNFEKYYLIAKKYLLKIKNYEELLRIYYGLFYVAILNRDSRKVYYYYDLYVSLAEETKITDNLNMLNNEFASWLISVNKKHRAIKLLISIKDSKENNNDLLAIVYVNIAWIYVKEKLNIQAEKHFEKALQTLTLTNPLVTYEIYEFICKFYARSHNYKKAYHYRSLQNKIIYENKFNMKSNQFIYNSIHKDEKEIIDNVQKLNLNIFDNDVNKKSYFLDKLVNVIPFPIFFLNQEGKYIVYNEHFTKLFNLKDRNLIGTKFGSNIGIDDSLGIIEKFDKLGYSFSSTHSYISSLKINNIERSYSIHKTPFSDKSINLKGNLTVLVDITNNINQKNELANINSLFKTILNASPSTYIAVIDKNDKYLYFNENYKKSCEKNLGYLLHKGDFYFDKYLDPEIKKESEKNLNKAKMGESFTIVREFETMQNTTLYFPMYSQSQQYMGSIIYSYDTSNNRSLNEKVASLSATNRKYAIFIKNDITRIFNEIENIKKILLISNNSIDDNGILLIKQIGDNIDSFKLLFDSMKNWSEIINTVSLKEDIIDLTRSIREEIRYFNSKIKNKKIKVSYKPNDQSIIKTNKKALLTVLRLVINNAIKYSPEHSSIAINSSIYGKNITVQIIDSGIEFEVNKINKALKNIAIEKKLIRGNEIEIFICNDLINYLGGEIKVNKIKNDKNSLIIKIPIR